MTEKLANLALYFCGYSLQIIISRKILENGAVILTYADVYDQPSLWNVNKVLEYSLTRV